jgi:hypothetical protein
MDDGLSSLRDDNKCIMPCFLELYEVRSLPDLGLAQTVDKRKAGKRSLPSGFLAFRRKGCKRVAKDQSLLLHERKSTTSTSGQKHSERSSG